jgi:hypothetical protein
VFETEEQARINLLPGSDIERAGRGWPATAFMDHENARKIIYLLWIVNILLILDFRLPTH